MLELTEKINFNFSIFCSLNIEKSIFRMDKGRFPFGKKSSKSDSVILTNCFLSIYYQDVIFLSIFLKNAFPNRWGI